MQSVPRVPTGLLSLPSIRRAQANAGRGLAYAAWPVKGAGQSRSARSPPFCYRGEETSALGGVMLDIAMRLASWYGVGDMLFER